MARIMVSRRGSGVVALLAVVLSSAFVLEGCKGGRSKHGHSHPNPPASNPVPAPAQAPAAPSSLAVSASTKTLHFTWPTVSGASYYKFFENADGVSGFSQIGGNLTAAAYDMNIAVHLLDWPNARYMVEACNSGGCSASGEVTATSLMLQTIGTIQKITEANFGSNVAISADGNTLAITSPTVNGVYIYTKSFIGWTQQALVQAGNPVVDATDGFGMALSLSETGNVLAVGTNLEDGGANDSGAAYIFTRSNNVWSQQAYIKASNAEAGDDFGNSIALSADGTTLAVGASGEDSNATGVNGNQASNSASASGAVYVFTLQSNTWIQQAYLKSDTSQPSEQFGSEAGFGGKTLSLSSDGNTLAVGSGNSVNRYAYVFTRSLNTWSKQTVIQSGVANDYFGRAVSLSADGNTMGISANTDANMGAAYVYVRSGTVWSQQAYLQASNAEVGDTFARTIALSADGNTFIAASYDDSNATGVNGNQNDNSVHDSGAVYVFQRSGNVWSQRAYVKAPEVSTHAFFGRIGLAVSGDGRTLIAATSDASVFMY